MQVFVNRQQMRYVSQRMSTLRLGIVVTLLFLPRWAWAASFNLGDQVVVPTEGNTYTFGRRVLINTSLHGDAIVAAERLTVTEDIGGDLLCAVGELQLSADVGGDVRCLAQVLTLTGHIDGDLLLFGRTLATGEGTRVEGNVQITGESIRLVGSFSSPIVIRGRDVALQGTFSAPVTVEVEERLTISSSSLLKSDLTYLTPLGTPLQIPEGVVRGTIYPRIAEAASSSLRQRILPVWTSLNFTSQLIVGSSIVLLWSPLITRGLAIFRVAPWQAVLRGVLSLLIPPLFALLCILLVFTLPLGLAIVAAWASAIFFASALSGLCLAALLFPRATTTRWSLLLQYLTGMFALSFLSFLPLVGRAISLLAVCASLGTLWGFKLDLLRTSSAARRPASV